MENFVYLPISSFAFPELASAEAVSPTKGDVAGWFVGRGGYPTRTSGDIPVNPIEDVLVLYSQPVTWNYTDGIVMDYPLVVKMPRDILCEDALTELELPSLPEGVQAWAYTRTVFFTNEGRVKYLFRSDEEMLQQIQRLLPFQEIKNLGMIKDCCESFEDLREAAKVLPDSLGDEIRYALQAKNIGLTCFAEDLRTETRTGACLGFRIGKTPEFVGGDGGVKRAEELLNNIRDEASYVQAERLLHDIRVMQQNFAQLVTSSSMYDYGSQWITFKAFFRYEGRHFVEDWNALDPMLQKCVDFIAAYPRTNWNWYGNEERFEFMRLLWNDVIKPCLDVESPAVVDSMRTDAQNICRHFKNPNSVGVDTKSIASPLMQALYVVLQSSGEPKSFNREVKSARRRDLCLALYGAFKGYSYFSRTLVPERIRRTPAKVSKEDILSVVSFVKEQGGTDKNWNRIIQAVDRAMELELDRQSAKAFLYILNNLMPKSDDLYQKLEAELKGDTTDYDYVSFKAKIRQKLQEIGAVPDKKYQMVMLAVELEDKRHDPVAFKYILDDCIREGGDDEEYRRTAKMLVRRLDLLYGGKPSDVGDPLEVDKALKKTVRKPAKKGTKSKSKKIKPNPSEKPQQGEFLLG